MTPSPSSEAPTWPDATSPTMDHRAGSTPPSAMLASSQSEHASNPCRYPPLYNCIRRKVRCSTVRVPRRRPDSPHAHDPPRLAFFIAPVARCADRRVVTCSTPFVSRLSVPRGRHRLSRLFLIFILSFCSSVRGAPVTSYRTTLLLHTPFSFFSFSPSLTSP